MAFTAKDHQFMRALRIDPDEPKPEPTNEELANAIIARGMEAEEEIPLTIEDWEDYAVHKELEARTYYKSWKECEYGIEKMERRNRSLRYALAASASLTSVLALGVLIYWARH